MDFSSVFAFVDEFVFIYSGEIWLRANSVVCVVLQLFGLVERELCCDCELFGIGRFALYDQARERRRIVSKIIYDQII